MSPEEIGRMTLADLEAIADRLEVAVKTILEARALLSGSSGPVPQVPAAMAAVAQIIRGAPNPLLTAAENAERQRLIRQNFAPDDIDALENS